MITRRERVDLSGVPETLLWNLYHRALAAREPRSGLHDPWAIELVEHIDYPFERFDAPHQHLAARWHALRVRTFDEELRRQLSTHRAATVVALGEGLETQFWRVDNGTVQWRSVDVAETVALRRSLLPEQPRTSVVASSAIDESWLDGLDRRQPVIVTAQGLLMYLARAEVHALFAMLAARLPGATMLFDLVPDTMARAREQWSARATSSGYQPPEWTWTPSTGEQRELARLPSIASLQQARPPRGQGLLFGVALPALRRIPGVRERLPVFPVVRATLAGRRR